MKIFAKRNVLSGHIQVPGSKSHTIRALLLAALAEGESHISNPLPSADCLSTARALPLIGSCVDFGGSQADEGHKQDSCADSVWTVSGAGLGIHLPDDVVNVGNSGSLLYFLSPIAATFEGWSVFTGDESIRRRPVYHVVDALNQLGAHACTAIPDSGTCPLLIKGPISAQNKVVTGGTVSSQYISGLMMSALLMKGTLHIELTDPKETPYLVMTQKWLEKVGAKVSMSSDFKKIEVTGCGKIKGFDAAVPSDWEGVAFPLIAALLTDSEIVIDNVDGTGTQGDDAIVEVLQSLGADIEWDKSACTLTVRGGKKSRGGIGRLSTEKLPGGELHVNLSGYPDAVCAVAVAACFTEGSVYIEDIGVCRRKETDRIVVMKKELEKLGAVVEEGDDFMIIRGHSPVNADGSINRNFILHGGTVESWADHRVAMSLACLGLGLPSGEVIVNGAECCSVSFPAFFEKMNTLGSDFAEVN